MTKSSCPKYPCSATQACTRKGTPATNRAASPRYRGPGACFRACRRRAAVSTATNAPDHPTQAPTLPPYRENGSTVTPENPATKSNECLLLSVGDDPPKVVGLLRVVSDIFVPDLG